MLTVGVLALQGAVAEHLELLGRIPGVRGAAVKTLEELQALDGLILPGGESTAIGRLLRSFGLLEPLHAQIAAGLPVWGTCAGLILLARRIAGESAAHLGLMGIVARRNAYGGQLDSFRTEVLLPAISARALTLVFIRAPYIESVAPGVEILAEVDGKIVAAAEKNMLVTAFHPELTGDVRFHQYFIERFVKKIK